MILARGGRLWVLARRSSEAEEVPDASRLNGGVRRNPPPPIKLRAGPGLGSCPMGQLRNLKPHCPARDANILAKRDTRLDFRMSAQCVAIADLADISSSSDSLAS